MTDTPDATPVTPPPHVQPYTGRECSYMAVGACNKCGWCDPTVTDTPDATPAEATSHLYGDTDAMRWTDAFASLFKVTRRSDGQDMDTDGLMLGWFANAIETGRDAGAARATAAERERIRQLVLDEADGYDNSGEYRDDRSIALRLFADLLGGASHSAQTVSAAPGSVPKVTGPEPSHHDRSVTHSDAQHHPCQCQECT